MRRQLFASQYQCEDAMRRKGALLNDYHDDPRVRLVVPGKALGERVHTNTLKAMVAKGTIEVLSRNDTVTVYRLKELRKKQAASS